MTVQKFNDLVEEQTRFYADKEERYRYSAGLVERFLPVTPWFAEMHPERLPTPWYGRVRQWLHGRLIDWADKLPEHWLEGQLSEVRPIDHRRYDGERRVNPIPRNSITGESIDTGGGNDESASVFTVTNGATIPTAGLYTTRVTAAGAVTGVILQPGTYPAQEIMVVHEGAAANTITPAVAATSNIADGVSGVIAGLTAKGYIWDSAAARWFRES